MKMDELGNIILGTKKSLKCCECDISIIGNPWFKLVQERETKFSKPICSYCMEREEHIIKEKSKRSL